MSRQTRDSAVAAIPAWYSPWVHLAVPSLGGVAIVTAAIVALRDVALWELGIVPVTFVLLNAAEWALHRDLLHRRRPPFQVLYDRHTPLHHAIYTTDDMAIRSARELRLVLMPAFAILAAFAASLPIPGVLWAVGQRNLACLFAATTMAYLVSYEWLHAAYHLPPDSLIGRLRIIGWLRRHHATHHDPRLMQKWNFNVTVPLWDLVRGTVWRGQEAPARGAESTSTR